LSFGRAGAEREFNEMSIDEANILRMLRPRSRVPPPHSHRHASVKEWVDKMQAFGNWKLFLLIGASLVILADG
jgi:hypothetical protein